MQDSDSIADRIQQVMNKSFCKMGFCSLLFLLLMAVVFVYMGKRQIASAVKTDMEKYKPQFLPQNNLEVWKEQKQLAFEFVEFMETEVFSNPNIINEKKKIARQLNQFHGKLYLIFDADIIEEINHLLSGAVSPVQRYYLYREIRKQLLSSLSGRKAGDNECPYVSLDVQAAAAVKGIEKPNDFGEMKKNHDFIEAGDRPNTYKGLPYFKGR